LKLLLLFFLILNTIQADEIKRIESIVEDITKLRVQYKECKASTQTKVDDVERKNKIKIKNLENQISKYEKMLKIKEKEILALKNEKNNKKDSKSSENQICKKIIVDKPNEFPKLVLKDKYNKQNIIKTKPSTYRLNKDAFIYDSINGKKIEEWEKHTSFTSNTKSNLWVKITGFFINKVWVKSESSMWVPLKDVRKR